MANDRNENAPPADDDFEDFGPEDLEPIRGSHGPVAEEEDYEEWPECPEQKWRREWLENLVDPDDRRQRVVELNPFFAAVVKGGVLYVVRDDKWTELGECCSYIYSDEELRDKVNSYLPFL